jgi:hypothetical protein
MGPSNSTKYGMIARNAGGPFSPNRPNQRLKHRQYSPAVLSITVRSATATHSFEEAAELLSITLELKISPPSPDPLPRGRRRTGRPAARKDDRLPRAPPDDACHTCVSANPAGYHHGRQCRIQTAEPHQGPGVHESAWGARWGHPCMATKTSYKRCRPGRFRSTAKPSGSIHPRGIATGPSGHL